MNAKGFALIEMIIVVGIIGLLLVTIVTPAYLKYIDDAEKNICLGNRHVIEQAEQRLVFETGSHSQSFQDLVDGGYIKTLPSCPAGGVYAWMPYPESSSDYQTVLVCSIHGVSGE